MCMRIFIGSEENCKQVNPNPGASLSIIIDGNTIRNREMHKKLKRYIQGDQEYQIVILENITAIGEGAFKQCNGLKAITIPQTVATIGKDAFNGCKKMEKVVCSKKIGVTEIGDNAFSGCCRLETPPFAEKERPKESTIELSHTITAVGAGVFKGCHFKTNIIWMQPERNKSTSSRVLMYSPVEKETINIPSVDEIGDEAFEDCKEVKTLYIHKDVRKIGWFSFSGCSKLKKVEFLPGTTIEEIGGGAFYDCKELENFQLPKTGIKRIHWYAFVGCPKIEKTNVVKDAIIDHRVFHEDIIVNLEDEAFLDRFIEGVSVKDNYKKWMNHLYMWPMSNGHVKKNKKDGSVITQFEDKTVSSFNEARQGLDSSDKESIKEAIKLILIWGGENRYRNDQTSHKKKPHELDDFTKSLIEVKSQEEHKCDTNYLQYLVNKGNDKQGKSRIAFWSKILSGYKPGTYFIYDSRVVLALSYIALWLNLPIFWAIPKEKPKKKNQKTMWRLNKIISANQELFQIQTKNYTISCCYELYLKLLSGLAKNDFIKEQFNQFDIKEKDALKKRIIPKGGDITSLQIPSGNDIRLEYKKVFNINESQKGYSCEEWVSLDCLQKAIKAHLEKMLFMMKEDILKDFS